MRIQIIVFLSNFSFLSFTYTFLVNFLFLGSYEWNLIEEEAIIRSVLFLSIFRLLCFIRMSVNRVKQR